MKTQSSNPAIQDGVNVLNVLFLANRLKVATGCTYLIKSLEQQAYGRDGKPTKGIGGVDDIQALLTRLVTRCLISPHSAATRSGNRKLERGKKLRLTIHIWIQGDSYGCFELNLP